MTTIEEIHLLPTTTTPYPFLVIEPKDADFNLPEDRSPGTESPKNKKRPNKNKRKNPPKNQKTGNNNKLAANKQKEKPMTTKIYNYLSREVMPTVGVGLVGLVVTAGLASYFFGPLGALRRSYDDATDRRDDLDNMYAINSEEYAGPGGDGQNEEEIFGKFIAGMPANYMPKYVKQFTEAKRTRPVENHPYGSGAPNNRRVYPGQKFGQPGFNGHRNPGFDGSTSYSKVAPSPHYSQIQYSQHQPVLRNHQPRPNQPLANPYKNYQELQLQQQKSMASNMELALKQQNAFIAEPSATYTAGASLSFQEKSSASDIQAEPEISQEGQSVASTFNNVIDKDVEAAALQRRRSQFVVGSILPVVAETAVVTQTPTPIQAETQTPEPSVEDGGPISPVAAPLTASHGPRRRRRSIQRREAPNAMAILQTIDSEIKEIESLFDGLKLKIGAAAENQTNVEKVQKEVKHIEYNIQRLRRIAADVKDIEQFQKEFHIKNRNTELALTVRTGILRIRNHISYVGDQIDRPDDKEISLENYLRENVEDNLLETTAAVEEDISTSTTTPEPPFEVHVDAQEGGLTGILQLLQLKAVMGMHILESIRPSFERAFEEVFRMPSQIMNRN